VTLSHTDDQVDTALEAAAEALRAALERPVATVGADADEKWVPSR
jgi:hypothetical protein